ncbi:HI0074 family nucleotidyltransferase substrate-binding subunit [Selenomonas ruminantium]|uniref:HI0074 family nucleotidyltransferase substrate-binding subunit n=1 Tax=Selenomonas ruminantium TaxID=971 RepID=UPI002114D41D|nr:HI0074 family nucleotidyltransferase substrate-binding subunit [Selenomonas ruminantium]
MDTLYTIKIRFWQEILKILQKHSGMLEWVKLFGSRARGDARISSDVDLAVYGNADAITKLSIAFEDSSLPYTFDIIDYKRQTNEKLKQAIDRDGKLIFSSAGGTSLMTRIQIEAKKEDYHRALMRLQVALSKEPDADDMYLDATIQRFEFCFELAWKLMKACLDYEGIEASSPRSSIREGWKQGMIADAEAWLDMQEKRNLSAHTYNESTALEVYQLIKDKYASLLLAWDAEVQRRLESDMSI